MFSKKSCYHIVKLIAALLLYTCLPVIASWYIIYLCKIVTMHSGFESFIITAVCFIYGYEKCKFNKKVSPKNGLGGLYGNESIWFR